jgi:tetratricopeptide (TPR) repeat protein
MIAFLLSALPAAALGVPAPRKPAKKGTETVVSVHTGIAGCQVDVDGSAAGKTNLAGALIIGGAEPGDHYLHADCPGKQEISRFVSLPANQTTDLDFSATDSQSSITPLEAAQNKIELRNMVLKAVRSRARGQFDEAVRLLREATQLDPANSDLHRELGITFLLSKEWQRARVEMLEAIRHDPQDADAHNGLGYALEKLGDLEQALSEYHTATRLDPTDTSYREHYYEVMARLAARQVAAKK